MKDPDAETRERIDDLRAELARKDEDNAALREALRKLESEKAPVDGLPDRPTGAALLARMLRRKDEEIARLLTNGIVSGGKFQMETIVPIAEEEPERRQAETRERAEETWAKCAVEGCQRDNLLRKLARKDEEIAGLRESVNRYDESVTRLAVESGKKDQRIRELESLVYVPGLWRCAKCEFSLVSTTMSAQTGAMRANESPHRCANGCGPMWRVTERDAGNRLCDRMEPLQANLARAVEALESVVVAWDVAHDIGESIERARTVLQALKGGE